MSRSAAKSGKSNRSTGTATPTPKLRERLLTTATELFRRQGFVATTVDEICGGARATKGAFFHHFNSKEAIAEACLLRWQEQMMALGRGAAFNSVDDPVDRALAFMDFMIGLFSDPRVVKSCLAGTTVQEVSETHPKLRQAAHACFLVIKNRLLALLEEAAKSRRLKIDSDSLATLWVAGVQGALVVCKASRDESVIPASMKHLRAYIAAQLESQKPAPRRPRKL